MPSENKQLISADFPEQVGVDSAGIKELLDDFRNSNIELHSLMILRHGKVAHECYAAPYGRDIPHTLYSVSKSVTSVAIGFAISEGLISLDSKVIDFFPLHRPSKPDEKLEKMTVYHLLTMTSGKNVSLISDKTGKDWVGDFFRSPWYAAPGEKYRYISENAYMCCAIIKKVTGMGVIDYLMPRLFEPLGITRRPFWETDNNGLEAGGWGLFLTPEELAKFSLCVLNYGKYAGRQVIPEDYIRQATSPHSNDSENPDDEWRHGYGFLFPMSSIENTPRCDGMFSQFGIMFRGYDAVLVCNCSEIDEDKTKKCIFRHCPGLFIEETAEKPASEYDLSLEPLPVLPASDHCITEQLLQSKVIRTSKNALLNAVGFPTSMLPLPVVYMSADKSGNIDNIILNFDGDVCTMIWDEGRDHNIMECGMDGTPRKSVIHLGGADFTALSSAIWRDYNTLEIRMRPLESISERILVIKMNLLKLKAELYPSSVPAVGEMAKSLSYVFTYTLPQGIRDTAGDLAGKLEKIVDAPIKAKIKL